MTESEVLIERIKSHLFTKGYHLDFVVDDIDLSAEMIHTELCRGYKSTPCRDPKLKEMLAQLSPNKSVQYSALREAIRLLYEEVPPIFRQPEPVAVGS